jgi:hypothetical protein
MAESRYQQERDMCVGEVLWGMGLNAPLQTLSCGAPKRARDT